MSKFKKIKLDRFGIIILVLALVLLIVATMLLIRGIKSKQVMTFSLGEAEVSVGETVEIPVELKYNKGIIISNLIVDYDADDLTLYSYSVPENSVFNRCEVNDIKGQLSILAEMDDTNIDMTQDGTVVILVFKAKISSDSGEYEIKFNDESQTTNSKLELLDTKYESGLITINEKK